METRSIDSLIPYDRNPRQNDGRAVEEVLESLRRHGQVKPIVLSAKGHPFEQEIICCGHTTMNALKKFGAKECSVIVHEFKDEAEFVDYNIRDNQSGTFSIWDNEKLVDLSAEFEIDLEEMGFDLGDKNFEPGDEGDQGKLDELSPKNVKCPHCQKIFDSRGHEQG
jgi:ParB-like chromosome segregation protein Spo0J